MQTIVQLSRMAYAICITCLGIQQAVYGDFDPVFLPDAFSTSSVYSILAYPWSIVCIALGLSILLNKKAFEASLISGGVFLGLFLFCQAPHLLFFNPNGHIIGAWTKALKELAFSGGSFVVAGSYLNETAGSPVIGQLDKLIPFGRIFFSITMIVFGVDHFLYDEFVATLVPDWIPNHLFWTYFAGVALIGSGVAIILKIKLRLVASLLGLMIFLWFIFLHIPRAFADPFGLRGNEMTSVFQSLGFSGVAFIIAFTNGQRRTLA